MKKLADRIRNLSVRKTILIYLMIGLFAGFAGSAAVTKIASDIQNSIWMKYTDEDSYYEAASRESPEYFIEPARPSAEEMTETDHSISELCDFLETYSVLIFSIAASCGAVFLFYRNKLKRPIGELERASRRIAENDLDFRIVYENEDEMGHLCREFDRMREQLEENNRQMWRMVEDEKELRAAIAHDIRSPLAVLKGYQEMLADSAEDGSIGREDAVDMLGESMRQVQRMERFINSMQELNSLEQREPVAETILPEELEREIRRELDLLSKDSKDINSGRSGERNGNNGSSSMEQQKIMIDFSMEQNGESFRGDREVILEVMENLVSNALRYARERIRVGVTVTSQELTLSVSDDGSGFSRRGRVGNARSVSDAESEVSRKDATENTPLAGDDGGEIQKKDSSGKKRNIRDSLTHMGMGLYISRICCERHGGTLILKNEKAGGAVVTAVFHRIA
ncbi:MAG: HAMP domain-containing sensor histidine kinase [Bilifractor sp.]|jgi:signal transduction histidine kinase